MIIKPFVNPLKEGTFNGKITLKTIKLLVDWMRIEKSMDVYQKVMPFFWDSEDDKWCTIEGSINTKQSTTFIVPTERMRVDECVLV